MEDTEWNDILRKKGIIKDETKKENEQEITIENQVSNQEDDEIDKLLELDDDDDVIAEYRRRRIAELKNSSDNSPKFGDLREITASDYVEQVNKAGDNIWVVLLLYERGIPSCTLMCQYFTNLAIKFPKTKFLKSLASLCVANFPEKNLPAVFIYNSGVLIKQLVGTQVFSENLTFEGLEIILAETGAIESKLKRDSKDETKSKKIFSTSLLTSLNDQESDDE